MKSISSVRSFFAGLVCVAFLATADALAWVVVYQVIAPSSNMAAIKFTIMAAAWLAWSFFVLRQYSHRHSYWTELGIVLQGIIMLAFVGSMLKAIIGNADNLIVWFASCLLLSFVIPIFRSLARMVLCSCGLWNLPTLVLGGDKNALQAVLALRSEITMGYTVAGVMLPDRATSDVELSALGCRLLPWPSSPEDFALLRGFHCVIALEAHEFMLRDMLIRQLSQYQVKHVHVIPAMRGVPLFGLGTTNFFRYELLMIHIKNNLSQKGLQALKRTFDIFGSIILLVLLSPLFAYLAFEVSRDGAGPFFGHKRVGQGGKEFVCWKFRSMVINAEEILHDLLANDVIARSEWENDFKIKNDPRINNIGHFLRRTSLDELPQLWNVLKGDMSLVGPRPVVREELKRYAEDAVYYLMIKPGMTGLWQVSGRNDVDYETRVYFDSWYVKNWSLWTDIAILFKTISVIKNRHGAY